jgi:ribosome biogenesis GTPase / thiamine phosphate phosphatase
MRSKWDRCPRTIPECFSFRHLILLQNMKGLVLKSTGKWYEVKGENGITYPCQIRGKLRLKGAVTTNPVAAGDRVVIEIEPDDTGNILEIEERINYIIRRSVNLSREAQIVAANLDQAMLLVTVENPQTTYGFIDRFLVTAEAYRIPVIVLFHKIDLYKAMGLAKLDEFQNVYTSIGYTCLRSSLVTGEGIDQLEGILRDKVTLISGHSGTGKSSLVNTLIPYLRLRTGEISNSSRKGQHTTTFAEMHELPFGGYLVDTPGIKGFGLVDIRKAQLGHYFREFFALLPQCRFANCTHQNEPGCAVIRAVQQGDVPKSRYDSYLSMWADESGRSPYR